MTSIDFADSRWFISYLKDEKPSISNPVGGNRLQNKHGASFVDRYLTTRFFVDVNDDPGNDQCIMQHSNKICILGLAPGHHVFHGCFSPTTKQRKLDASSFSPSQVHTNSDHTIYGIDFKLSQSFSLLDTKVSGRRKRGSHNLQHGNQYIGAVVCNRGVRHPLSCGIPGRLFEINSKLAVSKTENTCNPDSPKPEYTKSQIQFSPCGDHLDMGGANNLSYICILMPVRANPESTSNLAGDKKQKFTNNINLTQKGVLEAGMDFLTYKAYRNL